jgi:hypothetical protein
MADPQTKDVAVLIERLRKRRPEASDRELLESAVRIQRGRQVAERIGERFAGVSAEEIEREAVKAVHEVRRERGSRETSADAILARAGARRMSPEEFAKHFGDLPSDGEG